MTNTLRKFTRQEMIDEINTAVDGAVATSTYHTRTGKSSSTFIIDAYGESFVDNPDCLGNHMTHKAAVNCGMRFAKRHLLLEAQRLEDAHYV